MQILEESEDIGFLFVELQGINRQHFLDRLVLKREKLKIPMEQGALCL